MTKLFSLVLLVASCGPSPCGDWNTETIRGIEYAWPSGIGPRYAEISIQTMGTGTFDQARAGCEARGLHIADAEVSYYYIVENGDSCWNGSLTTWDASGGAFHDGMFYDHQPHDSVLEYHCSP